MKLNDPLMEICCNVKRTGRRVSISCKLGLWAVDSQDWETAENEARHYFGQYLRDGEYDGLIRPEIR